MTTTNHTLRPPSPPGPIRWLKKNLFSTWYNALLTVVAAVFLFFLLRGALGWVLFQANWEPVSSSLKLFAVGQYPLGEIWRVGVILLVVSFLLGVSWRVWGGTIGTLALAVAVGLGLLALLPIGPEHLFSVEPDVADALDRGEMPDTLREQFQEYGQSLALQARVEVNEAGNRWTIVDTETSYAVQRKDQTLDVYGPDRMPLLARLWLLGNPLLTAAGLFVGRIVRRPRWVLLGWLLSFVLMLILLSGIEGIPWLPRTESGLWGGLLLTFLLAIVGIVASFPFGVLLALGRRSSLPVLKIFCTVFIELVRGVPLVTILFMFSIVLPLFLPEQVRIDRVLRAMLAMTFFASAYMAENVRGGLQAISRGQIEAAKALGLNGFQVTLLIVLPQALRMVIPAIVGQFIALFMDTTLAYIVGLTELLTIGRAVLQSRKEWLLLDMEVFVFIAALFWVFTYAMSYASRRLEKALGVGQR